MKEHGDGGGSRAGVFLSYRRSDTEGHAGRLYDVLVARFGRDRVFMDIDSLVPGAEFPRAIRERLEQCDVLLALIGAHWLDVVDEHGRRRIDAPRDWVRLEIQTALRLGVRVIPVLVSGARMPASNELPKGIARLARLQAFEIGPRWHADVDELLETIGPGSEEPSDAVVGGGQPDVAPSLSRDDRPRLARHARWRGIWIGALLLALAVGAVALIRDSEDHDATRAGRPQSGATGVVTSRTTSTTMADALPLLPASRLSTPGQASTGIASDGTNLWIADRSTQVFRTDAEGTHSDVFNLPAGTPGGIVWNGQGFFAYTSNQNTIHRLTSDGRPAGSFRAPSSVIGPPTDMAWDGERLWFAAQARLVKLSPQGDVLDGPLVFKRDVAGVEWDGSNFWVAHNNFPCSGLAPCRSTLRKVDRSGKDLACFNLPVANVVGLAVLGDALMVLGEERVGAGVSIFRVARPTQQKDCAET